MRRLSLSCNHSLFFFSSFTHSLSLPLLHSFLSLLSQFHSFLSSFSQSNSFLSLLQNLSYTFSSFTKTITKPKFSLCTYTNCSTFILLESCVLFQTKSEVFTKSLLVSWFSHLKGASPLDPRSRPLENLASNSLHFEVFKITKNDGTIKSQECQIFSKI